MEAKAPILDCSNADVKVADGAPSRCWAIEMEKLLVMGKAR